MESRDDSSLDDEYHLMAGILTNTHSSTMLRAGAVAYFKRLFNRYEPFECFDEGLIDIFIGIVRDTGSVEDRTDAVEALANLFPDKHDELADVMMKKGAIEAIVESIRPEYDDRLLTACLIGVGKMAEVSSQCQKVVQATDVLEKIGQLMDGSQTADIVRTAIRSCVKIVAGGGVATRPETVRLIVDNMFLLMEYYQEMHTEDLCWKNEDIKEKALFIAVHLDAFASTDPDTASTALAFVNLRGRSERERMVSREDCLKLIGGCLTQTYVETALTSASGSYVRDSAMRIIEKLASGRPSEVDLLLMDESLMVNLLSLLHTDEQDQICGIFSSILKSLLAHPRPALKEQFLGYGVLPLINIGSKDGTDDETADEIREAVRPLLVAHPEFWLAIERAGSRPDCTPLLPVPQKKRVAADYVWNYED